MISNGGPADTTVERITLIHCIGSLIWPCPVTRRRCRGRHFGKVDVIDGTHELKHAEREPAGAGKQAACGTG